MQRQQRRLAICSQLFQIKGCRAVQVRLLTFEHLVGKLGRTIGGDAYSLQTLFEALLGFL